MMGRVIFARAVLLMEHFISGGRDGRELYEYFTEESNFGGSLKDNGESCGL